MYFQMENVFDFAKNVFDFNLLMISFLVFNMKIYGHNIALQAIECENVFLVN